MPARALSREMEYIAIRENRLALSRRRPVSRASSTGGGIRRADSDETVCRLRWRGAIIPANINHPEIEPMIIGRNFLVMNANIEIPRSVLDEEEVEKLPGRHCGGPTPSGLSTGKNIHETRNGLFATPCAHWHGAHLSGSGKSMGCRRADLGDLSRHARSSRPNRGGLLTIHAVCFCAMCR